MHPYNIGDNFRVDKVIVQLRDAPMPTVASTSIRTIYLWQSEQKLLPQGPGRVRTVRIDFEENNGTPGQENRIYVTHADGSVGTYLHLTKKVPLVQVGENVQQGMVIGMSGNTGNSSALQ